MGRHLSQLLLFVLLASIAVGVESNSLRRRLEGCGFLDHVPTSFQSIVVVTFTVGGDFTVNQTIDVEQAFMDSYNEMNMYNTSTCDPWNRNITSINSTFDLDLSMYRPVPPEGPNDLTVRFHVEGMCEGCSEDPHLFDPYDWELFNNTCPCTSAHVANRTSTEEEFSVGFSAVLQTLDFPVELVALEEMKTLECGMNATNFTQRVIVEFEICDRNEIQRDKLALEQAYVSAYNGLASQYCDEFVRTLDTAMIVEEGALTVEGYYPVEIEVNGTMRCTNETCDMDNFDFYEAPTLSIVVNRRSLADDASNSTARDDTCFCPADAIADRGVTEPEFIKAYQYEVSSLWGLDCVEAVAECETGTIFESTLGLSFLDFNASRSTTEEQRAELEAVALAALNSYFTPSDPGECNPDFRVFEEVEIIFLTDSRRLAEDSFRNDAMYNDTEAPSTAPSSAPTLQKADNAFSILLYASGVCNGCSNDLFLDDQISGRRLSNEAGYNDRFLEELVAKSLCYCALNTTIFTPSPDIGDFQEAFQEELDKVDSDLVVVVGDDDDLYTFPCTTEVTTFVRNVTIEIGWVCGEEEPVLDESQKIEIASSFVETYNALSPFYCDTLFRQLKNATVEKVGGLRGGNSLPIELRVIVECRGCDPLTTDVYGIPDEFVELGGERRALAQASLTNCTCSADLERRPPLEAEFTDAYGLVVQALPLVCLGNVTECDWGTEFSTTLVMSFEPDPSVAVDIDDFAEVIGEALRESLNPLLGLNGTNCNDYFGIVLNTTAVDKFVFNGIDLNTTDLLSGERMLLERESRRIEVDFGNITGNFSNSSMVPSSAPSMTPTLAPEDGVVYLLMYASGVCNGCPSDLFSGDQISGRRRLEQTEIDPFRELVEVEIDLGPESRCYCPVETIVVDVEITASDLTVSLKENLEQKEVPLTLEQVDSAEEVECDTTTNPFTSVLTYRYSAYAWHTAEDVQRLGDLIASTYNGMVDDYCDSLTRQGVSLTLVDGSIVPWSEDRRLEGDTVGCRNFEAVFTVVGECRGCTDGTSMLDIASSGDVRSSDGRRKMVEALSTRSVPTSIPGRRRLQDTQACWCAGTRAYRAPTLEELNDEMDGVLPDSSNVPNICGLPVAEEVQCPEIPTGSVLSTTLSVSARRVDNNCMTEADLVAIETGFESLYNGFKQEAYFTCQAMYSQITSITIDRGTLSQCSRRELLAADAEVVSRGLTSDFLNLIVSYTVQCFSDTCVLEIVLSDDVLTFIITELESLGVYEFLLGETSRSPSSLPSLIPTSEPTTPEPTGEPTAVPTPGPTPVPSPGPTSGPTVTPTGFPSSFPSTFPSSFPSSLPSVDPTMIPTLSPTTSPSASPTEVQSCFDNPNPVVRSGDPVEYFSYAADVFQLDGKLDIPYSGCGLAAPGSEAMIFVLEYELGYDWVYAEFGDVNEGTFFFDVFGFNDLDADCSTAWDCIPGSESILGLECVDQCCAVVSLVGSYSYFAFVGYGDATTGSVRLYTSNEEMACVSDTDLNLVYSCFGGDGGDFGDTTPCDFSYNPVSTFPCLDQMVFDGGDVTSFDFTEAMFFHCDGCTDGTIIISACGMYNVRVYGADNVSGGCSSWSEVYIPSAVGGQYESVLLPIEFFFPSSSHYIVAIQQNYTEPTCEFDIMITYIESFVPWEPIASSSPSSPPSSRPSAHPSGVPSPPPSSIPTKLASTQPSPNPTRLPSTQPSTHPTGQPSTNPTGIPSTSPSFTPTGEPSQQPSNWPSTIGPCFANTLPVVRYSAGASYYDFQVEDIALSGELDFAYTDCSAPPEGGSNAIIFILQFEAGYGSVTAQFSNLFGDISKFDVFGLNRENADCDNWSCIPSGPEVLRMNCLESCCETIAIDGSYPYYAFVGYGTSDSSDVRLATSQAELGCIPEATDYSTLQSCDEEGDLSPCEFAYIPISLPPCLKLGPASVLPEPEAMYFYCENCVTGVISVGTCGIGFRIMVYGVDDVSDGCLDWMPVHAFTDVSSDVGIVFLEIESFEGSHNNYVVSVTKAWAVDSCQSTPDLFVSHYAVSPSASPSEAPSGVPTLTISQAPSNNPTLIPSRAPSSQPSGACAQSLNAVQIANTYDFARTTYSTEFLDLDEVPVMVFYYSKQPGFEYLDLDVDDLVSVSILVYSAPDIGSSCSKWIFLLSLDCVGSCGPINLSSETAPVFMVLVTDNGSSVTEASVIATGGQCILESGYSTIQEVPTSDIPWDPIKIPYDWPDGDQPVGYGEVGMIFYCSEENCGGGYVVVDLLGDGEFSVDLYSAPSATDVCANVHADDHCSSPVEGCEFFLPFALHFYVLVRRSNPNVSTLIRVEYIQESNTPSESPTKAPTSQPSALPTSQPSALPSALPTSQPSAQPSALPTSQPSAQPSALPTSQPSAQPSPLPSAQPSAIPTAMASSPPTIEPSSLPTFPPSAQPSSPPSLEPSTGPTTAMPA